jgi:hypothetical protein
MTRPRRSCQRVPAAPGTDLGTRSSLMREQVQLGRSANGCATAADAEEHERLHDGYISGRQRSKNRDHGTTTRRRLCRTA